MVQWRMPVKIASAISVFAVLASLFTPPAASAIVTAAIPVTTVAPVISGTARVPNTLTVSNGTWSGVPTGYAYQWLRCTAAITKVATAVPKTCAAISTATTSSYALTDVDAGKFIAVKVTASNASGSANQVTKTTAAIVARVIKPVVTTDPFVTGTARVANILEASDGVWAESPASFTYQWLLCTAKVAASTAKAKTCKAITGATDSTYQVKSTDAKGFLQVAVTATNSAGATTRYSAATLAVANAIAVAPALYASPEMSYSGDAATSAFSGTAILGSVLVASKGRWLGFPLPEVSYSYWYRCDLPHTEAPTTRPADCYAISGSNGINGETYLVTADDVGKYLAFEVIATNASGTARAFTATTDAVTALPVLLTTPVLSGTPRFAQTLSVSRGTWSSAPGVTLTYSYDWFRCSSSTPEVIGSTPVGCETVSSESSATYELSTNDPGSYLVSRVTVTNSYGESGTAISNAIGPIRSSPVVVAPPTISGARQTGIDLSVSEGSWAIYPAADSSYQWYRCTTAVVSSVTSLPSQCSVIDGSTKATHSQGADDLGKYVTVATTKSNELGTTTVWSTSVVTTQLPIINVVPPALTGEASAGSVLTANPGDWQGEPSFSYSWYRCLSQPSSMAIVDLPADCVPLAGNVQSVSAGDSHSCEVLSDGTVKCWGRNDSGQLGDGSTVARVTPVSVSGISSAVSVSAGSSHSCAVLSDGTVKCWGFNLLGYLGDGSTVARVTPVSVSGISSAVSVSAGRSHSCALLADGKVNCWGNNDKGNLGNFASSPKNAPVEALGISSAVSVSAGGSHSCAVLSDGAVKCWGSNDYGQSGLEFKLESSTPISVPELPSLSAISAGASHSCATLTNGSVKCWGKNFYGQLGDGTNTDRAAPTHVADISSAVSVSAGTSHSCAVLSDGTVKCWGRNDSGQLGNGSTISRLTPTLVSGVSSAVSVSAGGSHSCAVLSDGTVKCWGNNNYGQLGSGSSISQSSVPSWVTGISSAVSVSAGGSHSCAVLTDATVKCWGDNRLGQLGDGSLSVSKRTTPYPVKDLSSAVSVSAGGSHTCAMLSDRTVGCWGAGASGQLGNGSWEYRALRTAVNGVSSAVSVSAGGSHSCAVLSDGSVKCWGSDIYGQLGENSIGNSATPVTVAGVSSAVSAFAGGSHSCVVLNDDSLRCLGNNRSGELGNDTAPFHFSPVTVRHNSNQDQTVHLAQNTVGTFLLVSITANKSGRSEKMWIVSDRAVDPRQG